MLSTRHYDNMRYDKLIYFIFGNAYYYTLIVLKTRSFRIAYILYRDRTRAKVCRNSTRNIIIHFHFTRTTLYQYNIICKIYLCAGRDCRMKKN